MGDARLREPIASVRDSRSFGIPRGQSIRPVPNASYRGVSGPRRCEWLLTEWRGRYTYIAWSGRSSNTRDPLQRSLRDVLAINQHFSSKEGAT